MVLVSGVVGCIVHASGVSIVSFPSSHTGIADPESEDRIVVTVNSLQGKFIVVHVSKRPGMEKEDLLIDEKDKEQEVDDHKDEEGGIWERYYNLYHCASLLVHFTQCLGSHGALVNMMPWSTWCLGQHGALVNMVPWSTWCLRSHGALVHMVPWSTWCIGYSNVVCFCSLFGREEPPPIPYKMADNETIHIFSLASGHLYERFLRYSSLILW